MKVFFLVPLFVVVLVANVYSQRKEQKLLKSDIEYLASDELKGRLAGSQSEKEAADYIAQRFKQLGLERAGENETFFHDFKFNEPVKYASNGNSLTINGVDLVLDKDFYIVPVSNNMAGNGSLNDLSYGIEAPELGHNDLEGKEIKGKIVMVNLGSPDGVHPHSKFKKYNNWRRRIEHIASKDPNAILVHNSNDDLSIKGLKRFTNLSRLSIPVIYLEDKALELAKEGARVYYGVKLVRGVRKSKNVIGLIDNKAAKTVFIGAHYDHLGYGEYGNSRYIGPPQIHNGADDNASGVALMLALAQRLEKMQKDLEHNYVFIAFSAEELGLLGSKAFVNDALFNNYKPTYMLNFDMVGRLNEENELGVYGTGTSTAWDSVFTLLDTSAFVINRNPSGMGSSDYTSFYLNKVPSIHFFTGSHEDYHKPTDDADKINYEGMQQVLNLSYDMVKELDDVLQINYKKTKSGKSTKAPSFKVTLGIIPDYFGDAKGLKIDGVSVGKAAEKAGMQKGDIIIKLGETVVKDMMTYMSALGVFDKGDKTEVIIIRAGKELKLPIQF